MTTTPDPSAILPGTALSAVLSAATNETAVNLAGRALSPLSRRATGNAVQAAIRGACPGLTPQERRAATVAALQALAIPMDDLEPRAAAAQADRML